jgi:hypothetical protein
MLTRICLSLALLVAIPAWCQVEPDATGAPPNTADEMQTPPPVNGDAYPTATGAETRSNYLRTGLTFETAYDDNAFGGGGGAPVSEIFYTIRPTIALDQTTSRLHQTFTYSPGFTIYQPTSTLNGMNQSASVNFQYRLTPHMAVSATDSFQKTTSVFNQPFGGVSGSTASPTAGIVAPFAEQLGNRASGQLSYQFSRNGMIGGGGNSTILNYPNPAQAAGLSNSNSRGGSAFYNLRLPSKQYIGVTYQYSDMSESSANGQSETRIHSINSFYTVYLKQTLSLSISGGPQHFDVAQFPIPESSSWTPTVTASMGWQRSRTNFAASYSRTVTGVGGLLGAFRSNNATASARWQLAHTLTVGSAASYQIQKNVSPTTLSFAQGGRSVSGTFSVQHPISEHFSAEFGYTRLHQSYNGETAIAQNLDSDTESISISYQFARPLGR